MLISGRFAGLSFEAICHKHVAQIRKALSIDPGADMGSWRYVPREGLAERGAQIDLLFDRPDESITLCEIKHSEKPFAIDKEYTGQLQRKADVYVKQTRTQKQIFWAMITSSGLKKTKYSDDLIFQDAELNDLFSF